VHGLVSVRLCACVNVCVSCECVFGYVYIICIYVYIMYMGVHVCVCIRVYVRVSSWVSLRVAAWTRLVRSEPVVGDSDSYSQMTRYTGDSKTDPWDDRMIHRFVPVRVVKTRR